MPPVHFPNLIIRQLNLNETIPYHLLLFADPSKALVDAYLNTADVYVAQLDGRTIAVYVLCPVSNDNTSIEIKNITVDTKFQNQGLGKYLLAHAVEIAKEKGCKSIIIGTANSSIGQIHLYQQQGFEMAELRKNFFIENYTEPIYENGIQAKHLLMLKRNL